VCVVSCVVIGICWGKLDGEVFAVRSWKGSSVVIGMLRDVSKG
jgi:hypothetical protein